MDNTNISRRGFMGAMGAAAAATSLSASMVIASDRKPRVVVIGGGAGGATAARYIAKDSKGAIDVTLIESTRHYYTCFFSNLYIGGFRTLESIGHSYGKLASEYGINVVHDWATGVDRDSKYVQTLEGHKIPYDVLVISPGVGFKDDAVGGWSVNEANKMPHAWKAGSQTELLKAQLESMPHGGTFCMVAPPNPFRCPPGPYERVSMIAHYFKYNNPSAKIIIADPKEKFSKMAVFTAAWEKHYPGMIEWLGPEFGGGNVSVQPDNMIVNIDGEEEKVDVCNVIPAMKAGTIASIAGVTNEAGWAPVDAHTMASHADENIFVIGDASHQGDMPKSGFSANSQAKVAAMAIRGKLLGSRVFPAKYSNTCWSLVATDDGIKVGASYVGTDTKIKKVDGFISKTGESAEVRKQTYEESVGWYAGITSDMFG